MCLTRLHWKVGVWNDRAFSGVIGILDFCLVSIVHGDKASMMFTRCITAPTFFPEEKAWHMVYGDVTPVNCMVLHAGGVIYCGNHKCPWLGGRHVHVCARVCLRARHGMTTFMS